MSKLILFADFDHDLKDGASHAFLCTLDDEINFSHRLGEQIIVANIGAGRAPGYEALAKLDHFSSDRAGNIYAQLESIRPFIDTISFRESPPRQPQIRQLHDDLYDEIISMVLGAKNAGEAFASGFISSPLDRIFAQVERAQKSYCSLSDIVTDNGVATFIRPLHHGGAMHVSNLLFLDGEASELFKFFGWTVGASDQIVIDLYSVTPDFAVTVNKTGKLVLRSPVLLDQEALAWHRQQFVSKRLS